MSLGLFMKTLESSLGFGGVFFMEPRYFIKPKMALTARYQASAYFTFPIEPGVGVDERSVNVSSMLGGVLFRDRASWNNWFWGVQTGVAITSEYIGTDADGFAIYGNNQTFWVLQPRGGYAFGRFEMELGYHYSPAREARFAHTTLGVRMWGRKKPKPVS